MKLGFWGLGISGSLRSRLGVRVEPEANARARSEGRIVVAASDYRELIRVSQAVHVSALPAGGEGFCIVHAVLNGRDHSQKGENRL